MKAGSEAGIAPGMTGRRSRRYERQPLDQPEAKRPGATGEAYLDDLDELLKEIDQLLSAVPIGKTKLEHQAREQAEDVAGRARATINCMKRDYIIAE